MEYLLNKIIDFNSLKNYCVAFEPCYFAIHDLTIPGSSMHD